MSGISRRRAAQIREGIRIGKWIGTDSTRLVLYSLTTVGSSRAEVTAAGRTAGRTVAS